jgi:hypothetical protein
MTISSPPVPDVAAICRDRLGRPMRTIERIGAGRNSRVFRVTLGDGGADARVVIKFYRHDAGDTRDRLATEFGAVRFLWQNGVRVIPRAIADDRDHHCAIYEYIDGDAPERAGIADADVDALVDFLTGMQAFRTRPGAAVLGAASEASFSLAALAAHVEARAERLRTTGQDAAVQQWISAVFTPLQREIFQWYDSAAAGAGQPLAVELEPDRRTLSPSDFGFHNAIRRQDGALAFVDFEYFGWDDPAKTVADFLLHPGMTLPDPLKRRFAERFLAACVFVPELAARARLVYPMFGLKWCVILLNDFLPDRATTATAETRAVQLQKADSLAARIRREYRDNPYLS